MKLALQAGCRFAAEPAGLFGWVDTGVDTDALAQRMLDEGYLLAPGALFHAERTPSTLMRINFATTQDAAFWKKYAELVKRCEAAARLQHLVGRERLEQRTSSLSLVLAPGSLSSSPNDAPGGARQKNLPPRRSSR